MALLAWIAWAIVILVVVWRGVLPAVMPEEAPEPSATEAQESSLADRLMTFQGKFLLGAKQLASSQGDAIPSEQLRTLEMGSVAQRQRAVALTGVLAGPSEGLDALHRLEVRVMDAGVQLTPGEQDTNNLLGVAFTSDDAVLSQADRDHLIDRLGWFGKLTVAGTQPGGEETLKALRSAALGLAIILVLVLCLAGLFALLGLAGLIVGIILVARRMLKPLAMGGTPSGVFVETFAAWLVLFLLFSLLAAKTGTGLGGAFVGFWLSLLALAWLPIRGLSWSTVMTEVGLTRGRGLWRELGSGVAGYIMMLPLLTMGIAGTLGLLKLSEWLADGANGFQTEVGPAHPIFEIVAGGSTGELILIYLLAAVAAPVVEEVMFRGVLYRHLRGGTQRWSTWLSIVFSAALSSLIFAAIHPQGWVAIPVLGTIGVALALAREWRSSLIAPMIMHAISNGLVITMVTVLILS
ncbi:MAG: CPBP family intramembrane metalloprotease [Phycisphaerales bacterium]|nr:CPBP family intramembrane metalloprotease [Phycisphaerales bacterium]